MRSPVLIALTLISLVPQFAIAETEREAYTRLAAKYHAVPDVRLSDGTIADMMSDTFVFECEWANKHWECIGQALHYAALTGKPPAIVLLVTGAARERRSIAITKADCQREGITLFLEPAEKNTRPKRRGR